MKNKANALYGIFKSPIAQFGRKVVGGVANWASPPPLSPLPQRSAKNILSPQGLKQAVNNVVALATLRPQLVNKFPVRQPLINPVVRRPTAINQAKSQSPFWNEAIAKVSRIMNPPRATPTPTAVPTRVPTRIPTRIPTAVPTGAPSATPTPTVSKEYLDLISKVRQGFSRWSGVPAQDLENRIPITRNIPQMVSISQENNLPPWLFPVLSIAESSGGQNVRYPTNPFNWGIRQGYNPASVEEAMRRMAYSFTTRPGFYQEKYQTPLQTGNYQRFFESYEPPEQNPNYWRNVQNIMRYFQ